MVGFKLSKKLKMDNLLHQKTAILEEVLAITNSLLEISCHRDFLKNHDVKLFQKQVANRGRLINILKTKLSKDITEQNHQLITNITEKTSILSSNIGLLQKSLKKSFPQLSFLAQHSTSTKHL